MKLPEIKYSRVNGARSTTGPNVAVMEHQHKQQLNEAVQQFGTTLAEIAETRQTTSASQWFTEDLTGFMQEHLQRPQYTAAEVRELGLESRIDLSGKENEATVPAWEVHPHLMEQTLRESINSRAGMINSPAARQEWTARAEQQASKLLQSAVQASGRERIRYDLELGRQQIDAAQQAGLFDQANELIDVLPISDEFRDLMRADNAQGRELHRIDRLTNGDDYQAMQAELDRVTQGETTLDPVNAARAESALIAGHKRARTEALDVEAAPFYRAMRAGDSEEIGRQIEQLQSDQYGGNLNDRERYTWINTLQTSQAQLARSSEVRDRVSEWQVKRTFSQLNAGIADGQFPDPLHAADMADTAAVLVQGESTPDGLRTAAADYLDNLRFMQEIQSAQLMSPLDQQERIQQLRETKVPAEQEGDRLTLLRKLEQVRDQTASAIQQDSMAYAQRTGQVQDVLPTPDSLEFYDILRSRNSADMGITGTYGNSTGVMTGIEADAMQGWLLGADVQQITDLSVQVNTAMGDRAPLFWEQLVKSGAGVMAVAGSLDHHTAQRVLVGNDVRQQDLYTPAQLQNLRSDALSIMGGAYGLNTIERMARAEAAVNYLLSSELLGSQVSVDDAVEAVTGGLVRFNGQTINAPELGVTSYDVESWVGDLAPEDLPFIRQGSREDILEQLQSGGINLIPSGHGQFELQRVDTGTLLTAGDGVTPARIGWPGLDAIQYQSLEGLNQITGMPRGAGNRQAAQ